MPTDGRAQAYGFLDQMTTEQLLALVRGDMEASGDDDSELMIHVLEVIEKRELAAPTGLLPDTAQAWEDFQTYFNTPDGTGRPLYPTEDSEPEKAAPSRRPHLLKRLAPLAAVLAVALSGMIAAQAIGVDIFGALARWTDETFHFVSEDETDGSEELRRSIQDALDQCGVTAVPAPSWFPKGTELASDIEIFQDTGNAGITCSFTCGDAVFNLVIRQYHTEEHVQRLLYEKDAKIVEKYSSNGRLFYLMSNLPDNRAVFSDDQSAITLSGTLSLKDMKQIIDSIGE